MRKIDVLSYAEIEYERLKRIIEEGKLYILDTVSSLTQIKEIEKPLFNIYQVDDNEASNRYVKNKIKKCEKLGIPVTLNKIINGDANAINQYLSKSINNIGGKAMIQFPVPENVNTDLISAENDVDGLCMQNKNTLFSDSGKEYIKRRKFFNIPCTARGIAEFMKSKYREEGMCGKNVVIVGRSDLVGKPLARLLEIENMTVTLAHSHTPQNKLNDLLSHADYVVVAVGKRGVVTSQAIPDGCVVIDVGINFEDGKLVGDFLIHDEDIERDFSYTPVPFGVGQLTVLNLMKNILEIPIYY